MAETKRARRLRWARALESGEFQQGRSALSEDDRYCCLGVACELMARDGLLEREVSSWGGVTYTDPNDPNDYEVANLPKVVQDYYGLSGEDPWVDLLHLPEGAIHPRSSVDRRLRNANSLVSLNDGYEASFATIARVIRLEPEGMVKR